MSFTSASKSAATAAIIQSLTVDESNAVHCLPSRCLFCSTVQSLQSPHHVMLTVVTVDITSFERGFPTSPFAPSHHSQYSASHQKRQSKCSRRGRPCKKMPATARSTGLCRSCARGRPRSVVAGHRALSTTAARRASVEETTASTSREQDELLSSNFMHGSAHRPVASSAKQQTQAGRGIFRPFYQNKSNTKLSHQTSSRRYATQAGTPSNATGAVSRDAVPGSSSISPFSAGAPASSSTLPGTSDHAHAHVCSALLSLHQAATGKKAGLQDPLPTVPQRQVAWPDWEGGVRDEKAWEERLSWAVEHSDRYRSTRPTRVTGRSCHHVYILRQRLFRDHNIDSIHLSPYCSCSSAWP